jgi:hypothetical protein
MGLAQIPGTSKAAWIGRADLRFTVGRSGQYAMAGLDSIRFAVGTAGSSTGLGPGLDLADSDLVDSDLSDSDQAGSDLARHPALGVARVRMTVLGISRS